MAESMEDFGTTEKLIRFIQEKSDDLEFVEIPQSPTMVGVEDGIKVSQRIVGMILYFAGGKKSLLTSNDAEALLNDGLLNRMKIKIKLISPNLLRRD